MDLDLGNETPASLAINFSSELYQAVSDHFVPEYEPTLKAMIISAKLSAQAVFVLHFEKKLSIDDTFLVLDAISKELREFITTKFN